MWLCCLVVRQNTLPNVAQSYKKNCHSSQKNGIKSMLFYSCTFLFCQISFLCGNDCIKSL